MYAKYAREIEEIIKKVSPKKRAGVIQSVFVSLKNELKETMPSYDVFRENFMNIEYKNSEQSRKIVKYILAEINQHYQTTREQKIDFTNVNIEHILPQKPDKKWNLKKKDIKNYVNKLGNLTLVDKEINSKVQNKIIREKIGELRKSTLSITKTLVKNLKETKYVWGEEQILARQEEFAKLAYNKVWHIH